MQFVIIARDGQDPEALNRRLAARDAHVKMGNDALKRGEHLVGAAMIDDDDKMRGSVMIVEYPSRKALDEWLAKEPYMNQGVWKDVEIIPCKIGPSFEALFKK